ncbi:MAG: Histidine kinase [Nocardioides sp.]|nr:Histidine kinase [Nocardioides sp.]
MRQATSDPVEAGLTDAGVLDAVPDGLWAVRPDGTTAWANAAFHRMVGQHGGATFAGTAAIDRVVPGDRPLLVRLLAALADGSVPADELHCAVVRLDGGSTPVAIRCTPIAVGWLLRVREDGGQQLLAELRHRESQLEEAQAIARTGSWEHDHATGELSWSREMYRVLGVDPATFVPRLSTLVSLLHPEDCELALEGYRELTGAGQEAEVEVRLHPVGRTSDRWVRVRGRVTHAEDGRLLARGTAQDVTEARESEQSMAFLRAMAELANQSSSLADMSARDDHVRHLSRWPSIQLAVPVAGHGLLFLPGWVDLDLATEQHAQDLAARAAARREVLCERSPSGTYSIAGAAVVDGEVVCAIVSDTRSKWPPDASGRSVFDQILLLLASVAEREARATDLAAARDEARAASRAKSEFLAAMSHEIRTPLTGVIGLTELLAASRLDAAQRQMTDGLDQAGRTLLSLVDDILDLSKIEAGRLQLETITFDPERVLRASVDLLAPRARDKDLHLVVTAAPDVPVGLVGDPVRFGQVVTNLVANAVKFTAVGEVAVRLSCDAGPDTGPELRVEVCDTGIGVEPDAVPRLFDPFVQADASTTRRYGGSGLGLAISSRIVEATGGRIGVQSAPGVGSTFWFTTPLVLPAGGPRPAAGGGRTTPHVPVAPPPGRTSTRLRVLVAEDNPINQLVTRGLLDAVGYDAVVVSDGAAAVAALEADPTGFCAVLMDCQMPVMDGWEATRTIRSRTRSNAARVVIIALTASVTAEERTRCHEAGMDDYLTKPVSADALRAALARITAPQVG